MGKGVASELLEFQTFAVLYAFFWVIPRLLNFICRHFGTLCLFHLRWRVGVNNELGLRNVGVFIREKVWLEQKLFPYKYPNISQTYPPTKMKKTECSEMSAYKIQKPGNYPEERIQHSEHGESLKSRSSIYFAVVPLDFLR